MGRDGSPDDLVVLRTTLGAPEVAAAVAGAGLAPDGKSTLRRTYLDSFDWRLHQAGLVAEHESGDGGPWLVLRNRSTGVEESRVAAEVAPRFAADLSPGPVGARLAEALEMRALLPLATVAVRRHRFRSLNADAKTVARVVIDELSLEPNQSGAALVPACRVMVEPLRGYGADAARTAARLERALAAERGADDLVGSVLAAAGLVPGSYSSKLRVGLRPEHTASEALSLVLADLLRVVDANRDGVRSDLDSEFLHDFRVSVRRARSVVSAAKAVLAPDEAAAFRAGLKWLGDATTPVRDLDVHLLTMPEYASWLPPGQVAELEPLERLLRSEQKRAHRALARALAGSRYQDLHDRWTALAEPGGATGGPDALRPAIELADRRIWKAFRTLLDEGRAIGPDSPDEDLHELRKSAKQLRYLLEAFATLYPAGEIKAVVRDLKGLQENLGDLQDAFVQVEALRGHAAQLLGRASPPADTLLAMGALTTHLATERDRARSEFSQRFEAFDSHDNRHRYRTLFRSASRSKPVAPDGASSKRDAP